LHQEVYMQVEMVDFYSWSMTLASTIFCSWGKMAPIFLLNTQWKIIYEFNRITNQVTNLQAHLQKRKPLFKFNQIITMHSMQWSHNKWKPKYRIIINHYIKTITCSLCWALGPRGKGKRSKLIQNYIVSIQRLYN